MKILLSLSMMAGAYEYQGTVNYQRLQGAIGLWGAHNGVLSMTSILSSMYSDLF